MKNKNSFPIWPQFNQKQIDLVSEILKSGKVNQWTGNQCYLFAQEFAKYLDVPYCVPLINGTVALELALRILNIGASDEVIVTPRSFIASASCVAAVGATPVFVDVENKSGNIDPDQVQKAISKKTKAVIAVHLAGWPCRLDELSKICKKKGIFLIEDCAQAHGASYKGRKVGTLGDISIFSFCQDKIMTTGGEGGMLVTYRKDWFEKAWSYKDHGKNYEKTYSTKINTASVFAWVHDNLGTNWRMTEIQAALGRYQLKKLDYWVKIRRRNAQYLINNLKGIKSLNIPIPTNDEYHSYYKFYCYLKPEKLKKGWNQLKIITEIKNKGVPVFSGSCPEIYKEKVWNKQKYRISPARKYLPVAKNLGENSLVFLVHPTLKLSHLKKIVNKTIKIIKTASN